MEPMYLHARQSPDCVELYESRTPYREPWISYDKLRTGIRPWILAVALPLLGHGLTITGHYSLALLVLTLMVLTVGAAILVPIVHHRTARPGGKIRGEGSTVSNLFLPSFRRLSTDDLHRSYGSRDSIPLYCSEGWMDALISRVSWGHRSYGGRDSLLDLDMGQVKGHVLRLVDGVQRMNKLRTAPDLDAVLGMMDRLDQDLEPDVAAIEDLVRSRDEAERREETERVIRSVVQG